MPIQILDSLQSLNLSLFRGKVGLGGSSVVDTDVFQLFLYELEAEVDKRRRNIVILDNASWHKPERLEWGVLEPWYLPTYSPDLNPIKSYGW